MIRDAILETICWRSVFFEVVQFGRGEQAATEHLEPMTPEPASLFSAGRVLQCDHALVFEEHKKILGAVTLATNGISIKGRRLPRPLIDAAYVTPERRREGVCTRLLIEALELFRRQGATRVHISCESDQMQAQLQSFCRRHFYHWSMLKIRYDDLAPNVSGLTELGGC